MSLDAGRLAAATTNDPWGELSRLSFDERCRMRTA